MGFIGANRYPKSYKDIRGAGSGRSKTKWWFNDLKKIVEDNLFEIHEIQKSKRIVDTSEETKSQLVNDLKEIMSSHSSIHQTWIIKNYNHKFKTALGSTIYFEINENDWPSTLIFCIE